MFTFLRLSQTGEITNLAGCDFLTIAPALLEKLSKSTEPLPRVLSPEKGTLHLFAPDLTRRPSCDPEANYSAFRSHSCRWRAVREGLVR